jgi:hypothetical protein
VRQTIAWLAANRAHLRKGAVVSINTPTCSAGHVRGILTASVAATFGSYDPFGQVDCTTTARPPGSDDVAEYYTGYATVSRLRG